MVTRVFHDHSEPNMNSFCKDVNDMCNRYFELCSGQNADEKCNWFFNHFWELYCRDCPKNRKTIPIKSILKPWITNQIKRMADYKHYLFKQYKMQNIQFETYNSYENNLNRIIKKSKREYFFSNFNGLEIILKIRKKKYILF